MQKTIFFKHKNKILRIKTEKLNLLGKIFGLMFTRKKNAKILLFEFDKSVSLRIHSFFVFFSFMGVWIDAKGKVIQIKKINPFTVVVTSKKPFKQLIEIPINKKYNKILKSLR